MTKTKKKTKTLDRLTAALETVVKKLRSGAPKTKQMSLGDFVSFAVEQLEQAAKDDAGVAKRRLQALKRNVDGAVAALAKLNAEDTDSESIRVEVTTAFAPSGDPRMGDLTTASDQSTSEVAPTSLRSASGDSAFAQNLADVAKSLEKLKAELEPPPDSKRKRTGKAVAAGSDDAGGSGGDAGAAHAARDEGGWPIDMASAGFLKGDKAASGEPAWGFDPDDVAARRGT